MYYTELKRREDMEGSLLYHSIHREGIKRALSPSHCRASPAQSAVLQDTKRTVSTYETSPLPPTTATSLATLPFLQSTLPPNLQKKRSKGPQYTTPQHLPHDQLHTAHTRSQLPSHPSQQAVNNPLNNPTHHPSKTTPPPTHPPHLSTFPKPTSPKSLVPTNSSTQECLSPSPSLHFTNVPKNHSKKKHYYV